MSSQVTAEVVCVFENKGTAVNAQGFILERMRSVAGVTNLKLSGLRIVRWSDPESNAPRQFTRSGQQYYRYNAQFTVMFEINGSYAEAQQWILDRLMDGEETSLMNVQSINLYVSEV